MAVARQYQQPRSVILGRVVKPGEALWLPEDLEWAIAYEDYLASLCAGCATPRSVWEGLRPGQDLPFVGVTKSCRGCEEKYDTEQEIPEEERKPFRQVVMVPAGILDRQEELDEARGWLQERRAEMVAAAERLGLPQPAADARPVVVG